MSNELKTSSGVTKDKDYVIYTENLRKSHGSQMRVKDLSLRVSRGSVYGFLGPNGA